MGIFSSRSPAEKRIEDEYVPILQLQMGATASEARKMVRGFIEMAKEKANKEGTSNLPANFGDILLEEETRNDKTRNYLAKVRKEGVRDEDIRWWWNMHYLDRGVAFELEETMNVTKWQLFLEDIVKENPGLAWNEAAAAAARQLRRTRVVYGDPEDTSNTTGEDRPLPDELRNRVNAYIAQRTATDLAQFDKDIEQATTFNAFLRQEIRTGNL